MKGTGPAPSGQGEPTPRARTTVVGSRYSALFSLGSGGMADAQLTLQTSSAGIERLVVVKRSLQELASQADIVAMFLEEARIATALSHPNIVQTYEAGQDRAGPFLVLEFLRGQTYEALIEARGYETYGVSIEVLLSALQGLEYFHTATNPTGRQMFAVHRDVSPSNLFVTYDGQVKLLDFGIAKDVDSSVHTATGFIKGKVAYMSPEQMRGAPLDARADLYAIGVMLWEATAARSRFPNVSDAAVITAQLARDAPVYPDAVARGLPELADIICARALAPDPLDRYSSAREFHEDLTALADLVGPRPTRRALAQYVSQAFEAERLTLEREIQAALRGLTNRSNETNEPVTKAMPRPQVGAALVPSEDLSSAAPATKPPHARLAKVAIVLALVTVAIAALTNASLSGRPEPRGTPPEASMPNGKPLTQAPPRLSQSSTEPQEPGTQRSTPAHAVSPSTSGSPKPYRSTPRRVRSPAAQPKPSSSPSSLTAGRSLPLDRESPWLAD